MGNISVFILFAVVVIFIVIIGIIVLILINKSERINQLQETINKLQQSFNELDEQAKLIVKTDLELNKAQEELDKRLHGLDALQRVSRAISTTLDRTEIFHKLNESLMKEMGFERALLLLYSENKKLTNQAALKFSKEDIAYVLSNLEKDMGLFAAFKEGHTFSSVNAPQQRKESIIRLFNVEHFIVTPIMSQTGMIGIFFVGNRSNALPITEGDEEIITILATQIGQSLENARLFEEVYKSHQSLEIKVQERTKQLASALEDVKQISQTKSEFISAVSHELRTPLTSIKGYASLLSSGKLGDIPDAVKHRLEKINTHSDNLVKLINDLLDISRIESGRVEMSIRSCSLAKLIHNVQDLLAPQMNDKNIIFKSEIASGLPELQLDSSQIERVFINLIGNAIKFTPTGGTIKIHAHLEPKYSGKVKIAVTDTGIGISEQDIKRLFDEFYRVENEINQNVKGTGLGLPLAKKIVEAHGGEMWVTSQENQGTTFHFTLPIEKDAV